MMETGEEVVQTCPNTQQKVEEPYRAFERYPVSHHTGPFVQVTCITSLGASQFLVGSCRFFLQRPWKATGDPGLQMDPAALELQMDPVRRKDW